MPQSDEGYELAQDPYAPSGAGPADPPPTAPTYDTQQVSYVQVPCYQCGYNLTGVSIGGFCPECGAGVDQSLYQSGNSPTNGKAIASMVLGICSIVTCCCPVPILSILGLVFGILAVNEIKTGKYSPGSSGMAITGLVCSGIALLLAAVSLLTNFL